MKTRAVVAVTLVLAFAAFAVAQTTTDLAGERLLRALLDEMRALRTTLTRNSAYELRANLLIERVRMYQQSVHELQREVEQGELERSTRNDEESFAEVLDNMEERLRAETDPERRKQLERERDAMVRRREMQSRFREQQRARFQRRENRLAEEREKLRIAEDELARLEREIAAQK